MGRGPGRERGRGTNRGARGPRSVPLSPSRSFPDRRSRALPLARLATTRQPPPARQPPFALMATHQLLPRLSAVTIHCRPWPTNGSFHPLYNPFQPPRRASRGCVPPRRVVYGARQLPRPGAVTIPHRTNWHRIRYTEGAFFVPLFLFPARFARPPRRTPRLHPPPPSLSEPRIRTFR